MDSGVAGRPLENIQAYTDSLDRFVHRSGFIMKPIFSKAKENPKRVIYTEGEDERVLRAAQAICEDKVARPILVGRPRVIETRIKRFGLSLKQGVDFDLIDPEDDPRYLGKGYHCFEVKTKPVSYYACAREQKHCEAMHAQPPKPDEPPIGECAAQPVVHVFVDAVRELSVFALDKASCEKLRTDYLKQASDPTKVSACEEKK